MSRIRGLATRLLARLLALLLARGFQRRREFQILTPQAIASARGTKWAMEVKPGETSTLVLA
jgi:hypothetical protein